MPKEYTQEEFIAQAKKDLDSYHKDWSGPPGSDNAPNEWHAGKHTWEEWWGSFGRYFSWEER